MVQTFGEIAPAALLSLCVVEDDADERLSLATLFGGLGVKVRTYDSAEDLLASLDQITVSMLVSELSLPGISGIELLRRLRERGVRPPAILLGEDSDIPTAVDAIRAGAVDFIEKPFIDRILLRRVRAALESAQDD
ncbi:MAG: response regulator [Gammaproteobacteria bacterium]